MPRTKARGAKALYTKLCARCGATKPRSEYYGSPTNRDGLMSYCRECSKACARESWCRRHPPHAVLRNGLDQALDEIAQKFGVSRERIRQIEARGIRKINLLLADLEELIESEGLTGYFATFGNTRREALFGILADAAAEERRTRVPS